MMDKEINEIDDWKNLRIVLNQDYTYNDEWEKAIKLFEKRLQRKFFKPIQTIINKQRLEGEGFAIVTVQCSLIEMLSAFREGKIYNHKMKPESPKFEYSESKKMFTQFLKTAIIFEGIFWHSDATVAQFDADDFYTSVRCGLMHEARTKNNWFINATSKNISIKEGTLFLERKGDRKVIFRTILHHRLLSYLEEYQNELRQTNNNGKNLRKFFARKLDHLFEIPPDKEFEWWSE